MMNLKLLRLTGVASALSAIPYTGLPIPVNDPSVTSDLEHKRSTRTGIVQPAYLVGDTDIAKSRHIAWVAIHDMKFTISTLYLPGTDIRAANNLSED